MTGKIKDATDDLGTIGRAGVIRILAGVILVLAVLLVWQQVRFTDRFTGTQGTELENRVNVRIESVRDEAALRFYAHEKWGRDWITVHQKVPHGNVAEQLEEISDRQLEILQRLSSIEAKQRSGG